jgi:uncharacterized phage-associated protein
MKMLDELVYKKATQGINFFARHENNRINTVKAVKLIWLADRYHLRKYGRPVIEDAYVAMKRGPVCSIVKDIAQNSQALTDRASDNEINYSKRYIKASSIWTVESIAPIDQSVLSDSDLEALEFAFKEFGGYSHEDLIKISHDYPEWTKFKETLEGGLVRSCRMSYEDFFRDPAQPQEISIVQEDKFCKSQEDIECARDIFLEELKIHSVWK